MRVKSILLGSCSLALAGTSLAADPPTREQLMEQIEKLQARVDQLEARQNAPATATVDQTVDHVMRDAERRSHLLADSTAFTAGYDKSRFFIRSEDGNWLLMPGMLFQVRNTTNVNTDGSTDVQNGFEIRRMRLFFEGNAFTPDLTYKFMWETNDNTGSVFLQDAWARYKFAPDFRLQAGQFKDGIHHEEAMADQYQIAADRSYVNALIGGANIDRVQGVMLMYDKGKTRVNTVVHDGYNTKNTDFQDAGGGSAFVGVNNLDFGFSARGEYFIKGTARQYDDFTAMGNTQDLLAVGAGADWSQGGDSDVIFYTADAQYENAKGLGLYGALLGMWRDIGAGGTVPVGQYTDFGGLVQASYMVHTRCDVFGRAEYISLDSGALPAGATEDTLYEFTIGSNYYWHGQNVKLTLDFSWLPDGSPTALPLLGIVQGNDDQFILRLQAQLLL